MSKPDPESRKPKDQLSKLQAWRGPRNPDLSLGAFLPEQFKKEVEKPYKALAGVSEVWMRLVPAELCGHTKLESLARGVLKVAVDSSARLYELDRLLRGGMEEQIIKSYKGQAFRKIQLRVGGVEEFQKPGGRPRGDEK